MDSSTVPDEADWSIGKFDFLQGAYAKQPPASMIAEQSMFSEDPLPYNQLMHHPCSPLRPKFPGSSAFSHLGLHDFNANIEHHAATGNGGAESSVNGYHSTAQSATCTNSLASIPSTQKAPQLKAYKHNYTKSKSPCGGGRALIQNQE